MINNNQPKETERLSHKLIFDLSKASLIGTRYLFNNVVNEYQQDMIKLYRAMMPNERYNITSQLGNTVSLTFSSGGNQIITLQDGFYNTSQLIDQIQKKYLDLGYTIEFVQNSYNYKYTLNITGNTIIIPESNILTTMLGFQITSLYSNSVQAVYLPNLMKQTSIIIRSNCVEFNHKNSDKSNILAQILYSGGFGDWIYHVHNEDEFLHASIQQQQSIWFEFTDQEDRQILFDKGIYPILEISIHD